MSEQSDSVSIAERARERPYQWVTLQRAAPNANRATSLRKGADQNLSPQEFEFRSRSYVNYGKRLHDIEVRYLPGSPIEHDIDEMTEGVLQELRPVIRAALLKAIQKDKTGSSGH